MFCQCLSYWKWATFLVSTFKLAVSKNLYSLYSHFLRYSAVACHKLNRFNSRVFTLDFTWNCCRLLEAKKFWRNPGQFKWVTRETRYCISIAELLRRNLMRQVAELFRRPRAMLKILYFSGDHHFFQKSPRINFLYHRGRELSIYWELSIYC